MTQNGWAFNVVNSADWVPEVPISIQTLEDFNEVNPFKNIKATIKQQKLVARVAMNHAYNKLHKPTKKAQENYQKFLGDITSKSVQKVVPGFEPPAYYESNNYVRTGTTIVLQGDEAYYKIYPNDEEKIFTHHFHPPYYYLAEKLNFSSAFTNTSPSSRRWRVPGSWTIFPEGELPLKGFFRTGFPPLPLMWETARSVEIQAVTTLMGH